MPLRSIGEISADLVREHQAKLNNAFLIALDGLVAVHFRAGVSDKFIAAILRQAADQIENGAFQNAMDPEGRIEAHEEGKH